MDKVKEFLLLFLCAVGGIVVGFITGVVGIGILIGVVLGNEATQLVMITGPIFTILGGVLGYRFPQKYFPGLCPKDTSFKIWG